MPESTVPVAVPKLFMLAMLVAVIFTVLGLGTVIGAVYNPFVLIVPSALFPPTMGVSLAWLTPQVTPVAETPLTDAVNCRLVPTSTVGALGVIVTSAFVADPHPAIANDASATNHKL